MSGLVRFRIGKSWRDRAWLGVVGLGSARHGKESDVKQLATTGLRTVEASHVCCGKPGFGPAGSGMSRQGWLWHGELRLSWRQV
jgi:hypothetical protein